jgi:hypothetical protein
MLGEDELREMTVSIAEHGLFVPPVMDRTGLGLDGRNRIAACALADVVPRWEVYDGNPIAFIVEVNAERRHLTTGQRAMAVAIGLVEAGRRRNGRFERGSVPVGNQGSLDYWRDVVAQAGLVLDHASDLADPVLAGEVALDAAHKQADEVRRQKDRVAALGGELAKLVNSGVITLDEAERRADEAVRVAALPKELVERVEGGTLTVDEAETIAVESERRLAAWAENIRQALDVLARLAGYPAIPADLAAHLSDSEIAAVAAVLAHLPIQESQ